MPGTIQAVIQRAAAPLERLCSRHTGKQEPAVLMLLIALPIAMALETLLIMKNVLVVEMANVVSAF